MKKTTRSACLLLLLSFCASLSAADRFTLSHIDELAQLGMPQLALRLLQREQPEYAKQPELWLQWESQRLPIMERRQDWEALIQRINVHPSQLPTDFVFWSMEIKIKALLALSRGDEARKVAMSMIWSPELTHDLGGLQVWRSYIIQSYLAEAEVENAYIAMLRYQQDYGDSDAQWLLLRTRVLIQRGLYDDALNVLTKLQSHPEAKVLAILARLRRGGEAATLRREAQTLTTAKAISDKTRSLAWAVVAEAAKQTKDVGIRALALEQSLQYPLQGTDKALMQQDADQLWQAYRDYAVAQGNRKRLLIGQDDAWLKLAQKSEKKHPVLARSIFALLSESSPGGDDYHQRLAQNLMQLERGEVLLSQLYLASPRFPVMQQLPLPIRYRLIDHALQQGNIRQASRLMEGEINSPKDADELNWQLRRARVFIMAGEREQGIALLKTILENPQGHVSPLLDRAMQVIFDLQNLHMHEQALDLFRQLQHQRLDEDVHRELFYWMADSYLALEQFEEAAVYYLRSANFILRLAQDQWAQSARYQAARALNRAGLNADARAMYEQLLRSTTDEVRRAQLQHELQQLWLQ